MQLRKCSQCNASFSLGDKFCRNCGSNLNPPDKPDDNIQEPNAKPDDNSRRPRSIPRFLFIAGAMVILVLVMNMCNRASPPS